MKGIEAINAIIILVLGVLTLLAVLGLFMGVWTPAGKGTSLQAATQTTCAKINPAFCKDSSRAARMPVFDFNANNQDGINEHTTAPATGCVAKIKILLKNCVIIIMVDQRAGTLLVQKNSL